MCYITLKNSVISTYFTGIPFIYNECTLDYSVGVGKDRITQAAPTIPNHMIWASTYNERRMPWLARLDEPTGKVSELCDGRGVHVGQDVRIYSFKYNFGPTYCLLIQTRVSNRCFVLGGFVRLPK